MIVSATVTSIMQWCFGIRAGFNLACLDKIYGSPSWSVCSNVGPFPAYPWINSIVGTILFTIGYSFSDLHINLDIQNGLYRSQKRLTLVSFIGNDTPAGCLLKWASDPNISNQIRVYAKNAFIHGENRLNSSVDLPWWKFESLVRLMEGEKLWALPQNAIQVPQLIIFA